MSLTTEVAQKSLRRLGRHPLALQHALLEMDLSHKMLNNIDVISQYPHVMHLDVSNNAVVSLAVLSNLPALVELNAR
jgi:Leucine-rich repeat (LRR) protein